MQNLRWTIFHSLLIFLIFVSVKCADPSGAGLNAASCSPINGLNQQIEIETGVEGYEGPVALPVTIAKEIEGWDATTLFFQEAAREQSTIRATKEGTTVTRDATTIIGTIYGYPQDTTSCPTGAAFVDNANIATLSPLDAACLLGLPITQDLLDEFIALAICSPEDCDTISEPVIVQLIETETLDTGGVAEAEKYTLQVIVTNTSTDATDPDSNLDISNARVAFMTVDDEEVIAFTASTTSRADENHVIAGVNPKGGSLTEIASVTTEPTGLYDNPDGTIVFMGADNNLHNVDALGGVSDIELTDVYSSESARAVNDAPPPFKMHPSGHHVVYFDTNFQFHLRDLISGTDEGPINITNAEVDPTEISAIFFDFSTLGDVIAIFETVDDAYTMLQLNVFDAELNAETLEYDLEADVIVPLGDRTMHNPVVDNFNYVYFQCNAASLCRLDLDVDHPVVENIEVGDLIRGFELARDGRSYIVLDLTITNERDRSFTPQDAVAILPINEDGDYLLPALILHFGSNITPSRQHPGLLGYNYFVNGYNQIGIAILNRRLQLIETELTVPETLYVPLGMYRIITPEGGMPPYEFSFLSGLGTLHSSTGRFQPTQPGTAVVQVTDYSGHTASSTLITGDSGTAFNHFGDEGIAKLTEISNATVTDLRVTQNQKIIVTGYTNDNQLIVASFNTDGSLDTEAFDGAGYLTSHIGAPASETRAHALRMQINGNFLVAGYASPGSNKQFMLVNYSEEGIVEEFGNDGIVLTDFGFNRHDVINDIVVGSTGRIYAAGYTNTVAGGNNFALARYTVSGELDAAFGTEGLKTFDVGLGQNDQIEAITLSEDRNIVVVGRARLGGNNHAIIMKLDNDGTKDFSFGTSGVVDLDFSPQSDIASAVSIDDDDIYVMGTTDNLVTGHIETFVTKLSYEDGSVRTSFGDGGTVTLGRPNADTVGSSLIVRSGGKILIGGYFGDLPETRWMIKCLDANGELDDTFGTRGTFLYSEGTAPEAINAMVIGSDGFLYVAGQGVDGDDLPLAIGAIWP